MTSAYFDGIIHLFQAIANFKTASALSHNSISFINVDNVKYGKSIINFCEAFIDLSCGLVNDDV